MENKKNIYEYEWVLFGAGNSEIYRYLIEHYENIIGVVDNDSRKWNTSPADEIGTKKYGGGVYSPDYLLSIEKENVLIIISTYSYWEEIKEQLHALGWQDDKILIAKKDIDYFSSFEFKLYSNHINLEEYMPDTLNLELSGICNCKCIYCPFHGEVNLKAGHKKLMKWETLYKAMEQIREMETLRIIDTTGPGEIFINPDWFEMLQLVLDNTNINNVCMYTNGMLLTKENVEKILKLHADRITIEISIDGRNPAENDEYRIGVKYEVIKENIIHAQKIIKDSHHTGIGILITNCYPAERMEIEKEDYVIDSKQNEVPAWLPMDFPDITIASQKTFFYGDYDIELSKFDKVSVTWPNNSNRCLNLFSRIAINYAGELLRCSCGAAGILGIANVFENDILKVWKEEQVMNQARNNFIVGKDEEDFCTGCPGKGMGNYYLLVRK